MKIDWEWVNFSWNYKFNMKFVKGIRKVNKLESHISSNHFFDKSFSKNVAFTKFLSKSVRENFHKFHTALCTGEKFFQDIFVQEFWKINSEISTLWTVSMLHGLISRKFFENINKASKVLTFPQCATKSRVDKSWKIFASIIVHFTKFFQSKEIVGGVNFWHCVLRKLSWKQQISTAR